jgi:hypothetical protein
MTKILDVNDLFERSLIQSVLSHYFRNEIYVMVQP